MAQSLMNLSTLQNGQNPLGWPSTIVGNTVPSCNDQRVFCTPIRRWRGLVARAAQAQSSYATQDHHAVLGVSRLATKQEIKKTYRRLALEYHPDVCRGDHCSLRFQQITRAYEALLKETTSQFGQFEDDLSDNLEGFMGVGDDNWEEWEEWMGWEGAGTYDYTNHVNGAV